MCVTEEAFEVLIRSIRGRELKGLRDVEVLFSRPVRLEFRTRNSTNTTRALEALASRRAQALLLASLPQRTASRLAWTPQAQRWQAAQSASRQLPPAAWADSFPDPPSALDVCRASSRSARRRRRVLSPWLLAPASPSRAGRRRPSCWCMKVSTNAGSSISSRLLGEQCSGPSIDMSKICVRYVGCPFRTGGARPIQVTETRVWRLQQQAAPPTSSAIPSGARTPVRR